MSIAPNQIRRFSQISLLLNLAAIFFAVLFYAVALNPLFGIIMSCVLITAWIIDLGLVLVNQRIFSDGAPGAGGEGLAGRMGVIFLAANLVAVPLMILGMVILALLLAPVLLGQVLLLGAVICVYGVGAALAFYNLRSSIPDQLSLRGNFRGFSTRTRWGLGAVAAFFLVLGAVWVVIIYLGSGGLFKDPDKNSLNTLELLAAQTSAFFLPALLVSTTILAITLSTGNRPVKRRARVILVIGLVITGLCAMPVLLTPLSISTANQEFTDAFGTGWQDEIPARVSDAFFFPTPYNFPAHTLGLPEVSCRVTSDVLYYEGEGIRLYFDVYQPPTDSNGAIVDRPGNGSTIILIHGGSWKYGDKGIWNDIPLSRYLAAQGYTVFDVQYRLRDDGRDEMATPTYLRGENFTIGEMVEDLGYFTRRLEAEYAQTYGARLDSVYIMGRSAGGHLAALIGLAYNNRDWSFRGAFSDQLELKGIVPIYPADDARYYFYEKLWTFAPGDPETQPELFDALTPSHWADAGDPPTLIFWGTTDSLVPAAETHRIERAMEDAGADCCLLEFPLAGHANEVVSNANFGQVWTFYAERFLYLTHA